MSTTAGVLDQVDDRTLAILEHRRETGGLYRRGWLVRRALLAADLVSLSLAFVIAEQLSRGVGSAGGRFNAVSEDLLFAASLPAWVVAAKLYGLYDKDEERTDHSTADDFAGVFHLVTVVTWLLVAVAYLTPIANPRVPKLVLFWAIAITVIPLARATGRAYCRRQIQYLQNTIIVGAGDVGQELAKRLVRHPEYGLNLVGFVDSRPRAPEPELEHVALLGDLDELCDLARLLDVERVIFAFSVDTHDRLLETARELNEQGVQVDIVPRLFEVIGPGIDMHSVQGLPLVGLRPFRLPRSSRMMKRALDVCGATTALLLLSPLFAVAAIVIKLDSRGPVFFGQQRAGWHGETFRIWKFRTMVADAEALKDNVRHLSIHAGGDARMFKVLHDPRLTRVGAFLRRFSIDELPQLLNVLTGEMSLVGPRPLILEEARHVDNWGLRRLDLKPGITGLWQVLGRSEIPFSEMIRLDYVYITSWSVFGDIRLILRTIPMVLKPSSGAI